MADIPSWQLKGDWFDVCSCKLPCPCSFAQEPTHGDCLFTLVWQVHEGHYGTTDLSGLGVVALFGFSVVGAAVGLALKEPGLGSLLLAFPVLIAGLLVAGALVLLWRAFCEFYVAVFRISEDLRALRQTSDADHAAHRARQTAAQQPQQPQL